VRHTKFHTPAETLPRHPKDLEEQTIGSQSISSSRISSSDQDWTPKNLQSLFFPYLSIGCPREPGQPKLGHNESRYILPQHCTLAKCCSTSDVTEETYWYTLYVDLAVYACHNDPGQPIRSFSPLGCTESCAQWSKGPGFPFSWWSRMTTTAQTRQWPSVGASAHENFQSRRWPLFTYA